MVKKLLLSLAVVIILIQLIRPPKNDSNDYTNDISKVYTVPADITLIMQRACNDCHSNHTTYPWYANIQPVGWWLQHHVDEGKEHLNFSDFAKYSPKKQAHKLEEVAEVVQEHEMPMSNYVRLHPAAELSETEEKTLINWALRLKAQIETRYSTAKK